MLGLKLKSMLVKGAIGRHWHPTTSGHSMFTGVWSRDGSSLVANGRQKDTSQIADHSSGRHEQQMQQYLLFMNM